MASPSTDHDHTPAPSDHDDHGGLHRDLLPRMNRRRALSVLGGLSVGGLLAACGGNGDGSSTTSSTSTTTGGNSSTTTAGTVPPTSGDTSAGPEIPDETQGPYPADGSNGPNVLTDGAVVRSDLTSSFGDLSGTAVGVPLALQLTVVDASSGSARGGAAVYAWHCTADGRYSIYEIEDQNYLRGIAETDDAGRLTFTTIFPGCYAGRWPHVHFEVYDSLATADSGINATKTSQLALPESDCQTVYTDDRYQASVDNLARLSLDSDNVFADGWTEQLATVSGSAEEGYTASLLVRI